MLYNIIAYSAGFFESVMLCTLLMSCFEKKYDKKIYYYLWIVIDYSIILFTPNASPLIGGTILLSLLFEIITSKLLYKADIFKIIFWIIAYDSVLALTDTTVMIFSSYVIGIDFEKSSVIGLSNSIETVIAKIILWVIVINVKSIIGKDIHYMGSKNYVPLLIVPGVSICAMILILEYVANVPDKIRNDMLINITISGMFIMNIAVFYIYERLYKMSSVEQEMSLMEQQLIYQQKYFAQLEENYQQIRGIKHDINRHISLIDALAKQGEYEKMQEYIRELGASTMDIDEMIKTGNIILDAIINEKYCIAKKLDINFQVELESIEENIMNPTSLCIIISNVLDNAIESCSKLLGKRNPMIQLKLYMQKNSLVLSVENDAEEPMYEKESLLTSKADKKSHGIGLKNVRRVVEEYNGYFETGYVNNKFIFVSRIPLNCKSNSISI